MGLDLFLTIAGGIFILVGLVGCVIPVIPGAPLSWCGLLIAFFSNYSKCSVASLVVTAIISIVVSILDNVFPTVMTKQNGGSKKGTWGATIGLIAGMFLGPLGIIAGPFCGAYVGEIIHDSNDKKRAFKCACGAFKGFLLGTGVKMVSVVICLWIFVASIIKCT